MRARASKAAIFWSALLWSALLLRVLVPAGWMPDADRPFAIMLCPDAGPATAKAPSHGHMGHHQGPTEPEKAKARCDFALSLSPFASPADLGTAVIAPQPAPILLPARAAFGIGRGLAAPPPPATGPPAFA